jgi:uncharacterized protein DUF6378/uncharacterized protein DUF4406
MAEILTAYISGPMTDVPHWNHPQFNEVAYVIRNKGLGNETNDSPRVVNPAENFGGSTNGPREKYLALDVCQVTKADALVLLPGWANSEGARLEVIVALGLNKRFFLAMVGGPWTWRFEEILAWEIRKLLELGDSVTKARTAALKDAKQRVEDESRTVEQEAAQLVRDGERQKTYGHPRGDFDRVAGMWSAILGITVTAEQVGVMMIAFKLARLSQTPRHRDSLVDVIGYAICVDRLGESEDGV